MTNRLSLRKCWPFIVAMIDLYTFLYAFEVYAISLPFSPSKGRMYIVVFLAFSLLWDLFTHFYLSSLQIVAFLYIIVVILGQYYNDLLSISKLASDLFFPLILILSIRFFSEIDKEAIKKIIKLQTGCLILFFCLFLYGLNTIGLSYGMFRNSCYYSALLLPFILCNSKISLRNGLILVAFIPSVIAAKRGAFLCVVFGILLFWCTYRKTEEYEKHRKLNHIWVWSTLLGIIVIMIFLSRKYDMYVLKRLFSVAEDGGSGRLRVILIKRMIVTLENNGIVEWLFGHGSFTSSKFIGNSSHNDFLEMLWSYGILGFIIYISIVVGLVKEVVVLKRNRSYFYGPCLAAVCSFFICSMISQLVFVPTYVAFLLLFFGMCKSNVAIDCKSLGEKKVL